ncbi:MAG: FtsX-like permease family protein [Clostridiaceae bacterium]|nr:FtsX-like permease family protein [Clostridiaceae bacterium]
MAIIKFMLGNLKNRRSYSIVISSLVFIAGLILTVTLSTNQNSSITYDKAFNNMKGPHLLYWFEEANFKGEFQQWFASKSEVLSVKQRKTTYYVGGVFEQKGKKLDSFQYHLSEYIPADNMRLIDAKYLPKEKLSKGEIYLPYILKKQYGFSAGDTVDYKFGANKIHFKIAGFIEEPLYGDKLNGVKVVFISNVDNVEILRLGGKDIHQYLQMGIRLKVYNEATVNKLGKSFMLEAGTNVVFKSSYFETKSNIFKLPGIVLSVMSTFAAILCIISLTIMRYAILATIEADYLNIGIIKALGFTPIMVQIAITGQYTLLAVLSGFLSLIAGVFITPIIGHIILESSGLYFTGNLYLISGILILFTLVFVITLFSYLTARLTKKISPLRAITKGIAPVYFSSRLNVAFDKIGFLPLDLSMAIKQVLSKARRYIILISISALLTYSLVFTFGFNQFFNSDKALNTLGMEFSDIKLITKSQIDLERLIKDINKDYPVEWLYYETSKQLEVEGESTRLKIQEDFDNTGGITTIKGRHPKHDNEVAISDLLKRKFNKDIGQYVSIKDKSGIEQQFIITGIFQTVDEYGSIVRITETGAKILFSDFQRSEAYMKLKAYDNLDQVIKEMKEKYVGYEEISNKRKATEITISTVKTVFSVISKVVLVITIIMISFVTLLILKITVYAEIKELGIYKALGFSSARLRWQLALRFLIVTVLGGIIGIVFETFFGSQIISLALRNVGISSLNIEFSIVNAGLALVIIPVIAMISAFISSVNIKKVSVYELINE